MSHHNPIKDTYNLRIMILWITSSIFTYSNAFISCYINSKIYLRASMSMCLLTLCIEFVIYLELE